MKNEKRIERVINTVNFIVCIIAALSVLYLCFAVCTADAQTVRYVEKKEILYRDTLNVTGMAHVEEYVKRDGSIGIRANWCGYSVRISKKDGNAILEGDDAGLVVEHWNDGEVIVNKIIAINMRRSEKGRGL